MTHHIEFKIWLQNGVAKILVLFEIRDRWSNRRGGCRAGTGRRTWNIIRLLTANDWVSVRECLIHHNIPLIRLFSLLNKSTWPQIVSTTSKVLRSKPLRWDQTPLASVSGRWNLSSGLVYVRVNNGQLTIMLAIIRMWSKSTQEHLRIIAKLYIIMQLDYDCRPK